MLAALCDILEVTPAELIVTTAENAIARKTASGDQPAPVDLSAVRPKRARLRPQ